MKLLAAFLTALLYCTAVQAGDKPVSLASLNWEPYVGESLEELGFTSEIVVQALKREGLESTVTFMPWKRVLAASEAGDYGGVYPAYFSDLRNAIYEFSDPIATSRLVLFKRKDEDISFETLEDLKGKRIGVVRGYVNTAAFDRAKFLTKEEANSDLINLKKLLKGRLDLVVIDQYTAQYFLKTKLPEGLESLDYLAKPLEIKKLYFIVSKQLADHKETVAAFNRGLKTITDDGTKAAILKKHGF